METQTVPGASRIGDSESSRKWIPIVVPLAAAVLTALIFVGASFVLIRT